MITRKHYLENGPEHVLLDMKRLSGSIFNGETYDYGKEVSHIARKVAAYLAPNLRSSDLPMWWTQQNKQQCFVSLVEMGTDLSKLSRMALTYEMMEDDAYWNYAQSECNPVLEVGMKRLNERKKSKHTTKNLQTLAALQKLLDTNAETDTAMGRFFVQSTFAAVLNSSASWTQEEFELLASHLVAHSRIGNAYLRKFNLAAEHLSDSLGALVNEIRIFKMEPVVIKYVNFLSQHQCSKFLELASGLLAHISQTFTNEQKEGQSFKFSRTSAEISRILSDDRLSLEERFVNLDCALMAAMTFWPLNQNLRMLTLSHHLALQNIQAAHSAALNVLNIKL